MPSILLPAPDAERRQSAHLLEWSLSYVSLCGQHHKRDLEEAVADTPENRAFLRQQHRHICGLCLDILRRRAQTAERKASRPLMAPTKRELEAEALARWNAAAKIATNPPPKHDEDHVANAAGVVQ